MEEVAQVLTPKEMLLLEVMAQDQAQALALAMRPLIKLQDKDLVVVYRNIPFKI